jgi:probable F420-dependent oxidoreductase
MKYVLSPPLDLIDDHPEFSQPSALIELASAADRLGFYGITASDHVMVPAASGIHNDLDPFVMLSAYARETVRIRLIFSLLVMPYRHPIPVAKALATLDQLSTGRLIVGVGTGYLEGEFAALGVPFESRNERTDEGLAVLKEVWQHGRNCSHSGPYVQFSNGRQLPAPLQKPHPPFWIGGNSRVAIRRAAREGAAWYPFAAGKPLPTGLVHTPVIDSFDEFEKRVAYAREVESGFERSAPLSIVSPQLYIGRKTNASGHGSPEGQAVEWISRAGAIGAAYQRIAMTGQSLNSYLEDMEYFMEEIAPSIDEVSGHAT